MTTRPLTEWEIRYIHLADHVAGWSKDPRTRVGAVLVGADRTKIALGYNGLPPGIADTEERLRDRDLKNRMIQHAERNVLDNADFPTSGATLVTTMFPCSACVKSILTKRIHRLVTPLPVTYEPWATDATLSIMMLQEAGVEVITYEGVVPPAVGSTN